MPERRRVLLLFEYPTLNGGERSMLAVLKELLRGDQWQFAAACPPTGPLGNKLEELGIDCWPLELKDTTAKTTEGFFQQLSGIAEAASPGLIHANSLAMGRRLGSVCDRLAIPCTSHMRDIVGLRGASVQDLNRLAGLVAVSRATQQFHVEQGLRAYRVTTIHNGVDLREFAPRPSTGFLKRELQLPERAKLALNVGQICLRKGHDTLAAAAMLLHDRQPHLHWVVCGERYSTKQESIGFERDFQRAFEQGGIGDRLHLLGYRDNVAGIMSEADLLVHAARQEPLGRVLLEASASGLPIVATNVGGTNEIVEDDRSGCLVEAGSATAMADAIESVLTNQTLAQSLGMAARETVERCFDITSAARGLADWWDALLD